MDKIAIIGGGLSGAWVAYLLADVGYSVTVYDDFTQPYRASETNPGGLNPLHGPQIPGVLEPFQLDCHRLHFDHSEAIGILSGIDYRLRVIDRLFLAFEQADVDELRVMQRLYDSAGGFEAVWLDASQARFLEPRLSSRLVAGLLTRGNGVVDSQLYNRALLMAARARGARLSRTNPGSLVREGGWVTHIEVNGRREACDAVVIANGCWTREFLDQLNLGAMVKPVKGEMLLVKLPGAPFAWDITHGLNGLYQSHDDIYWLGGTREDPSEDPGPSAGGRQLVADRVRAMVPGLGEMMVLRHCAGYRPSTVDGLPIAGLLPGIGNAYTVTGGGSKGVLQCAGLAHSLIELLRGRPHPYPYLSPGRFLKA
ncbi:MAG: FAD-binding oxidoreductase [Porticoccaceae bacterium]|nr:FAD-binding oxidoreductase [Porticoccaceae bacterium]